jgi:pyrimidine-nucleoside phosphorylase
MDILSIIEKKKNGLELSDEEINFWIEDYCKGIIPDYQVSALLMAIRFQGMTKKETFALTDAMIKSGITFDLSKIDGVKADKHSTGGVGDKTSMTLCPMIAALGIKVAKMSGRGLGFTGGTLDKLESIPGMSITLSPKDFIDTVNNVGMAIIGQSKDIVLADKKLYALRDVTGTVDSMPLIASSIMSKKLASGCDVILLDVKYGSGAFMRTKEDAEALAKLMVEIGDHFGKSVRAEITTMNQPLGKAIGNILEVKEAVETLHNRGPKDFTELCLSSGATMLLQAGLYTDREKALEDLKDVLASGKAFEIFRNFVRAQGGDVSYVDNLAKFPNAIYSIPVKSVKSGYVSKMDTRALGITSMRLGAGRETLDDIIDPTAGIILEKKLGDKVEKGDLLLTMYTEKPDMQDLVSNVLNAYDFSENPVEPTSTVEERIMMDETGSFLIERD